MQYFLYSIKFFASPTYLLFITTNILQVALFERKLNQRINLNSLSQDKHNNIISSEKPSSISSSLDNYSRNTILLLAQNSIYTEEVAIPSTDQEMQEPIYTKPKKFASIISNFEVENMNNNIFYQNMDDNNNDSSNVKITNNSIIKTNSILKHNRNQNGDDYGKITRRKSKVSFVSDQDEVYEIPPTPDEQPIDSNIETQSVLNQKGVPNWRNMLKNFYDEVQQDDNRFFSHSSNEAKTDEDEILLNSAGNHNEGIDEEEKFIREASELTQNEGITIAGIICCHANS